MADVSPPLTYRRLAGWLSQLKDMAVADVMKPDLAFADAGHHAECREQLQEVLRTLSIALYLNNFQMTCSPLLEVPRSASLLPECLGDALTYGHALVQESSRSRFFEPSPRNP